MLRRFTILLLTLPLCACASTRATLAPSQLAAAPTSPPLAQVQAPASDGLFFDGFDMFSAYSGWAWKDVSQFYRTDNGGTTWSELHLQGKRQIPGASFLSAQEAWLPGIPGSDQKQVIYHTVDGGMTWTALPPLVGPNLQLFFSDSEHGWALNGTGAAGNLFYVLYHTDDGARTWARLDATSPDGKQRVDMAGTIHVATGDSISFRPPETIWITSGSGLFTPHAGLTVSRDGGQSWTAPNPPLPAEFVKDGSPVMVSPPQFVSREDAYLPVSVGSRLIVFVSHNAGDSWALLPKALAAARTSPRVQFVSPADGFAACGPNLCVTHDGAQSWEAVATPFTFDASTGSAYVTRFDFVDANTGWAILLDEAGRKSFVSTVDGGRTWIEMKPRLGF